MSDIAAAELPLNISFFEVFKKVLNRWAYLECRPMGQPEPGPTALPVERSVEIKSPRFEGLMVLRAEPGFAKLVAESAAGAEADPSTFDDAFNELTNLFCGHLLSSFGSGDSEFRPFLPKPSQPSQWPGRQADRAFSANVEGSAVEMHFWKLGA